MFISGITSKLNQYFYYWEKRSESQVVCYQKVDPSKRFTKYMKASKLNPDRLFLFKQNGAQFKHSETALFSRQYRLELYFYKTYGSEVYDQIHSYLRTQLLYDFIKHIESIEQILTQLGVPTKLQSTITEGLSNYRTSMKKKKHQVRFCYVSKEPDSIDVINQIIKNYSVRRINYEYVVKVDSTHDVEAIQQHLVELFEKYKRGSTQYKLIL